MKKQLFALSIAILCSLVPFGIHAGPIKKTMQVIKIGVGLASILTGISMIALPCGEACCDRYSCLGGLAHSCQDCPDCCKVTSMISGIPISCLGFFMVQSGIKKLCKKKKHHHHHGEHVEVIVNAK